jgi:hypothetical protein
VTFLALSPLAGYALLGGVALVIVLLHLLKPRPLRAVVASTLVWARVLGRRRRGPAHWRRWLSLLLALGIGLSLALALTRPELPALGLAGKRTVLVLDNSPSMAARTLDGRSRWLHALERARALSGGSLGEIMVLDTMGTAPVSGFLTAAQATSVLDRLTVRSYGAAQVPPLPRDPDLEVHLITDGVARLDSPAGAIVHSVFEPADNVAITGLQARPFPADPTRYEAFVQVYNASPGPKQVRLTLRGGQRFALAQELKMAAGELIDASFDVSGFEGGILGAAASTPDDAVPLDDIAFTRVRAHRTRRVLLVTQGDSRLEDSIRALPGIQLTTVKPAGYAAAGKADAYVLDQFTPATPPPAGVLLFRPAPAPWLPAGSREIRNPEIASWNRIDPLTSGLDWRDLRIKRATVVDAAPREALVETPQGALIAAGHTPLPWIVVGFAPRDSNLPLQPGFPVFLGNALDWLTEPSPALIRPLGTIEVPMPHAQVSDGKGAIVPVTETADGIAFAAAQPDVYTVRGDGPGIQVIANVLDPREADINNSRLRDRTSVTVAARHGWAVQPWALLLLIGALLLILDWAAYTRRIAA